jgi:hypothetical protein
LKPKRKPNPEWDPVFKSNYRTDLLSHSSWVRKAEGLLDSASLLEPEVASIWASLRERHKATGSSKLKSDGILSVYLMLMAFAVENLLKAELVHKFHSKFRQMFDSSGKLPPLLKTHDLFILAQKAGLSMGIVEEDLLRRLTRSAIWAGRYPIPIEFGELASGEEFSDGKVWSVSYLGGKDVERLRKLIDKIRADFNVR